MTEDYSVCAESPDGKHQPRPAAVHDRDKADGADVVDWVEEKRKTDALPERQRAWRELREQRLEEP